MGASYSVEKIPSLEGKVAIVTGANTGIGKITALELARKGCHVFLASRSKERTLPVVDEIKEETHNEKIEFLELDLASLQNVRRFVNEFKEKELPLHILVNNAGIMACPFTKTVDGIEMQFATNHLGHFLLTTGLLDILEKSAPSRIVNVSSAAHQLTPEGGVAFDNINNEELYQPWRAYGQSKLCNVLFSTELARRYSSRPIYANAVHPGYVATELQRHFSSLYGGAVGLLGEAAKIFAKSPEDGALTSLYVATSPEIETNHINGQYFVPTAKLSKATALGRDEQLAAKLWEYSEALIERLEKEREENTTEESGNGATEESGKGKETQGEEEEKEEKEEQGETKTE